MTIALCPGSFDPPTLGHVDVIRRAASLFDSVVVAVVDNPSKKPLFSPAERIELFEEAVADVSNVEFVSFGGLLVDLAAARGATAIVKGIRTVGDYGYEEQMARMNRHVAGVETVFITSDPALSFISSSLVREVATLGGSVGDLVPPPVARALEERLGGSGS